MFKENRGFMLVECLIGIMILALISVFIFPVFQNMLMAGIRSEREVSLLFHSENIAENLMALYNQKSGAPIDLCYHDLDLVSLLDTIRNSDVGDVVDRQLVVRGERLGLQIQVLEKSHIIRYFFKLRLLDSTEKIDMDFVLSRMGG